MKDLETTDPKAHVQQVKNELTELVQHLRKDIKKINDPRAKALFETSAEVINGLLTAFSHYQEGREEAWK